MLGCISKYKIPSISFHSCCLFPSFSIHICWMIILFAGKFSFKKNKNKWAHKTKSYAKNEYHWESQFLSTKLWCKFRLLSASYDRRYKWDFRQRCKELKCFFFSFALLLLQRASMLMATELYNIECTVCRGQGATWSGM